jgi:Flp pilus assembly protein TadB
VVWLGGVVPLSEHEQRLLEQIEQALYAEDPKFANIYRGNDVRSHYRRRLIRAIVGLAVGIGLLLAGVVIPLIPLGVAGFVVMLAAVSFGVASWQRMTGHRRVIAREKPQDRPTPMPKRSVVQRLEDRWQRRQDDR